MVKLSPRPSRCLKDNGLEATLTWQRAYFTKRPEVAVFKTLHETANQVGCWDDVRALA